MNYGVNIHGISWMVWLRVEFIKLLSLLNGWHYGLGQTIIVG